MNDLSAPLTRNNLQILSVTQFTLSYLDTRRRATRLVLPEMSRIAIKRALSKNIGTYHYLFISYGTCHSNIILRQTKTTKKGSNRTARRTQRQMAWRRLNFPGTVNIAVTRSWLYRILMWTAVTEFILRSRRQYVMYHGRGDRRPSFGYPLGNRDIFRLPVWNGKRLQWPTAVFCCPRCCPVFNDSRSNRFRAAIRIILCSYS